MRRELRYRQEVLRRFALLAVLLLLSGCGFHGLYSVALPGGADLGPRPYHVVAHFTDVADLVPQASVKVDDVAVGRVDSIELDGWVAKVTLLVNGDVKLPANSTAQLDQSSLLGEKYISLEAPAHGGSGRLRDGAQVASSGRTAEVEDVLSALSLLLNGGGVAQLQTINRELGDALHGREGSLRSLLSDLDTFVGKLDAQRGEIVRALDSVNRLAKTLADQRQTIAAALDELPPALKVLAQERSQLTKTLTALKHLGAVGTEVIEATRADLIADLKALQPTLTTLAQAGTDLPGSLELLATYPFPRNVTDDIRGDYTNLYATVDLDLTDVLQNILAPPNNAPPGSSGDGAPSGTSGGTSGGSSGGTGSGGSGSSGGNLPAPPSSSPSQPSQPLLPGAPSLPTLPGLDSLLPIGGGS
ncbi:MAG TPA: MCE family protein [Mycobacteriales bacterium]|nr:MCE family protein [Mycobacteriales bacterium]